MRHLNLGNCITREHRPFGEDIKPSVTLMSRRFTPVPVNYSQFRSSRVITRDCFQSVPVFGLQNQQCVGAHSSEASTFKEEKKKNQY